VRFQLPEVVEAGELMAQQLAPVALGVTQEAA
jgi:hypothetical protein